MIEIIIGISALAVGSATGFIGCKMTLGKQIEEKERKAQEIISQKEQIEKQAKEKAREIIENAKKEAKLEASQIIREAEDLKKQQELIIEKQVLERKKQLEEELKKEREELKKEREELKKEREELQNLEKTLIVKEVQLEKRITRVEHKEEELDRKWEEVKKLEEEIKTIQKEIEEKEAKLKAAEERYELELQRIASMTKEEAKAELMRRVEEEAKLEAAKLTKEIEEEAQREAERKAKWNLVTTIQRLAPEVTTSYTLSVVDLPSNDLKGRIIGREGRNIRALELATGVDLIIDDTPDIVTISSFDPLRREIAKEALERLIADGRIHPGRIEEVVEKVREEMDKQIRKLGEETCLELGFTDVHSELYYYIGKLNYRTSYTQNVLLHTKEVAYLAGMMAAKLGLDEKMARRGGLMHDIGKSISHEVGGAHSKIGAELAKRYGEPDEVINAILYHHNDEPARYPEAVLVAAADALSAARPGARREALQSYINRLEKIEAIVNSFENVEKSFAIQAGREIRVIVNAEKLSDEEAYMLTKEIAKRIEKEVEFPGQIKVTTIRESRFVEVAK